MLYKFVLNTKNRGVQKDMANIHGMHMTVCRMFDKGILWRLKDGALYVRGCMPRFIPRDYILSMAAVVEVWDSISSFELTANPTRVIRDRGSKNGRRVFTDPLPWIERKAAMAGFEIVKVKYNGPHTVNGYKRDHRMVFSRVDFSGTLKIVDRDAFFAAVEAGIGPSKGYGFGLIMKGVGPCPSR